MTDGGVFEHKQRGWYIWWWHTIQAEQRQRTGPRLAQGRSRCDCVQQLGQQRDELVDQRYGNSAEIQFRQGHPPPVFFKFVIALHDKL